MDIIHKTVRINDVGSSEKQVTVAFDNKVDNAWTKSRWRKHLNMTSMVE